MPKRKPTKPAPAPSNDLERAVREGLVFAERKKAGGVKVRQRLAVGVHDFPPAAHAAIELEVAGDKVGVRGGIDHPVGVMAR